MKSQISKVTKTEISPWPIEIHRTHLSQILPLKISNFVQMPNFPMKSIFHSKNLEIRFSEDRIGAFWG